MSLEVQQLPSGTVTFLFTDIEGSTKLAQEHPHEWENLRVRHHEILQSAMDAHNGHVFQIIGDAFCVAFHTASDGLNAAIDAQRVLQETSEVLIRVRMGIHTGEAELQVKGDYHGYLAMSRVQRLMSAGHGGQVLVSQTTQELIRDKLPKDMTLRDMGEHKLKDVPLPARIFQVVAPDLQKDFPALRTLSVFPNNLPAQITSFVGREKELADVKKLLQNAHMLTLIGPGGTGKTRLSIQAASESLEQYRDGVWLVELAPIPDSLLVPRTTAIAIGLREEPQRPVIDMLCDYLREKKMLLILDNCEHLVDACAQMANKILQAAQHVRVLASSREALGIAGEVTYRVPSLGVPDVNHLLSVESLSQYEAVKLFIDRATSAVPSFKVTNDNAPFLAQICHRLDGIPLAIELAAAKIRVLNLEQIAKRLDDRFRLLTGGSRTALERHQTLRAAIDWSYNLLPPNEQVLFRRLSVFVGGWTLEAAESVCSDNSIRSDDVLELLEHLINKSIVIAEETQIETRYSMLEMMRQYAREKLFETEEAVQIRDRHLDYFQTLAEKSETEILNANQVEWLKRLQAEFENLRAALEWSQENRVEVGLRLGSAVWKFCLRYGYRNELFEKLQQLLKQYPETMQTIIRAKTLYALSILAVWRDDNVRAYDLAKESLAICKESGDQSGEAAALYALGVSGIFDGDTNALAYLLQSLTLYRVLDDKISISEVLIIVNQASQDVVQRKASLEEALALARARGDAITMAGALDNLGALAMDLEDYSQARSWLEESLTIQRQLGESGYSNTLRKLGTLAIATGNYDAARTYLENARSMEEREGWTFYWTLAWLGHLEVRAGNIEQARLRLIDILNGFSRTNNTDGITFCLEGLASLAVVLHKFDIAVSLFAWTDKARTEANNPRPAMEQRSVERDLAVIREHLDESTFNTAYNAGYSMLMNEAIKLATEV